MFRSLALCLACVPLSLAHATSMVAMDVYDQADESHAFVEVVVGKSTVVVTDRMVYTDTELTVVDVIGGSAPSTILLRQAGGVLPERTVYLPGDARLEEGEHALAFVRGKHGHWYLTALGQSYWHIQEDGALTKDVESGHLMERGYDGKVRPATRSLQVFDTTEQMAAVVSELPFGGAL